MRQLLYQRSNRCLGFQAEFGLFLWATGASRATIEACHQIGLSVSYQSVLNLLAKLAGGCMALAVLAATAFYAFCYDNINISTSIHVEQQGSNATPGKVTSGTLGIVYPLPNATPEAMELEPILDRMRNPDYQGLSFDKDLVPKDDALAAIFHQFCVHIIQPLARYTQSLDLSSYDDPLLLHQVRRQLPEGQRT